jgi:hypothetical protein
MLNFCPASLRTCGPLLLGLCLLCSTAAMAYETCVPKAGGGWLCGANVTQADAAPIVRKAEASRPPILLIDPNKFGQIENNAIAPMTAVGVIAAENAQAPLANPTAQAGGGYTLQLARASAQKGFAPLLQRLKLNPKQARIVPAPGGSFLLLYGNYQSLEAARAAIPAGAKGAFARANDSKSQ